MLLAVVLFACGDSPTSSSDEPDPLTGIWSRKFTQQGITYLEWFEFTEDRYNWKQEILDDPNGFFSYDVKLLRDYRGAYRLRWSEANQHFLFDLFLESRGSRLYSRSQGKYLEAAEQVTFGSELNLWNDRFEVWNAHYIRTSRAEMQEVRDGF